MGQKVNPVGLRVGINRDWNSKWFAKGDDFAAFIDEDVKIRRYLDKELRTAMLSRIEISRSSKEKSLRIAIYAGRPGDIIGQEGENKKRLLAGLAKIVKSVKEEKDIRLDIVEVKNPDLDATLIAKWIASELENRAAFRSTMKKALTRMRKAGAKGCRTLCSGRLAGAEIARSEGYKDGVVPLHTLRADIDFASVHAATTYGNIGVKVWICRSLNKTDTETVNEPAHRDPRDERRPGPRRPERKGDVNNAATKAR